MVFRALDIILVKPAGLSGLSTHHKSVQSEIVHFFVTFRNNNTSLDTILSFNFFANTEINYGEWQTKSISRAIRLCNRPVNRVKLQQLHISIWGTKMNSINQNRVDVKHPGCPVSTGLKWKYRVVLFVTKNERYQGSTYEPVTIAFGSRKKYWLPSKMPQRHVETTSRWRSFSSRILKNSPPSTQLFYRRVQSKSLQP